VLCTQHKVAMQYILSHCGILGNEKADQLVKDGCSTDNQSDADET
jgi:ribonuclease HI